MAVSARSQRFSAPKLPLPPATVWSAALSLLVLVLVADIMTPASFAVGTVFSACVAFAALGSSKRVVWQLTGLCLLANLFAGIWNGLRDGANVYSLANRSVSILSVLLVGFLAVKARDASERALQLADEERQLTRERALRELAEDMGGPLGQKEFVDRAAASLLKLTGASSVEVGAIDKAVLGVPHALALAPDLTKAERPSRLNTRIPLDFLAHPVGAGDVWAAEGGHIYLARLRRPTEGGDLLVILTSPTTPPSLTGEAIHALQPLLERTTLLDDLRANRKMLAERGELLRDLVYAFSHDLRTPVMANIMNMQSALGGAYGELPAEYKANLHNGLAANETLLALADQLLLVAKYESGEDEQEAPQTVHLREQVLSVLADLKPRIQAQRIVLDTALTDVSIEGRKHDLRRAIQNLLDNAIKFSPPGGTVRVSLYPDGDEAVFSVQNSGRGISAAQEARLFQRFRGSGAGSGSGLGLYLTRRIAEDHGGNVRYRRGADSQTIFTLTLPQYAQAWGQA